MVTRGEGIRASQAHLGNVSGPMQTTVEPLEDNRVKLHVAVPAEEFESAVNAAFRKLAGEVRDPRVPSRQGAAPDPRGPLRHRRRARAGAQGRPAGLLRRRGRRRGHRRDRPAGDRDHRGRGGRRRRVRRRRRGASGRPPHRATTRSRSSSTTPRPDDDGGRRPGRRACASASADLEESTEPLIDGNYAEMDISGSVDGEPVDALTATDFLYEVGSDGLTPALDDALRGKKPGDIVEFTDALPERFGELAGQEVAFRVLVKDDEAQGAARAHRRVGLGGHRVRDRRRPARRQPRAHRDGRQAAGADGAARPRARRARRRSCPSRRPIRSSSRTWSAASTTSCTGSRPRASTSRGYLAATGQDQATFVDRDPRGLDQGGARGPRPARRRRAGGDRGDRRGARRRDRPSGRADGRKARPGAARSRQARGAGGGTL